MPSLQNGAGSNKSAKFVTANPLDPMIKPFENKDNMVRTDSLDFRLTSSRVHFLRSLSHGAARTLSFSLHHHLSRVHSPFMYLYIVERRRQEYARRIGWQCESKTDHGHGHTQGKASHGHERRGRSRPGSYRSSVSPSGTATAATTAFCR